MQPRMVAYMANDTSQEYTYSGARFMPGEIPQGREYHLRVFCPVSRLTAAALPEDPWDPFVLKIKEEVEKHTEGLK